LGYSRQYKRMLCNDFY